MYIRLQISDVWFVVIKEKEMPSICAEYVVKVSVFVIFYFFPCFLTPSRFCFLVPWKIGIGVYRAPVYCNLFVTKTLENECFSKMPFKPENLKTRLYVFVRMETNLETKLFKDKFSSNTNPIWPDIVAFSNSSVKGGGKSISDWNLRGLCKQHLFVRSFIP